MVQTSLFIERLYQQIEHEMLQNIGKIIGNGEGIEADGVVNWQLNKLRDLGILRIEQLKVLAKYSGMTVKQMQNFIHEEGLAEIEAFDGRMKGFNKAGIGYIEPTNSIYMRLLALENQGADVMNMVNSNMISGSEQVYKDIITKASADVLTGNATLSQAVIKTAKEWAELGVPVLIDKGNRRWSAEAYTNMVIRNTQKNVAVSMQEGRMDDYDIDLVEITSHRGSRPSHVDYQGRIYSRSGKSKKYPALSSTSYGLIDGIVTGINCSHLMYPFINGLSTKRNEPYNKKESEDNYIESQRQRLLERNIRKAKKEKAMLESMGVDDNEIKLANAKVSKRQKEMREFIDDSGRTRRREKEQVVKV